MSWLTVWKASQSFQAVERRAADQPGESGHRRRMPHGEGGRLLQPGRLEQRRPVEAGRLGRERLARPHLRQRHVGRLHARGVDRGHPRLEVDDRRGARAAPRRRPSGRARSRRAVRRPCAAPPSSGSATRSSRDRAGRGRPAAGTACCGRGPACPARRTRRTGARSGSWWRSADRRRRGWCRRWPAPGRGGRRSPRWRRAPASTASGPWPRCRPRR